MRIKNVSLFFLIGAFLVPLIFAGHKPKHRQKVDDGVDEVCEILFAAELEANELSSGPARYQEPLTIDDYHDHSAEEQPLFQVLRHHDELGLLSLLGIEDDGLSLNFNSFLLKDIGHRGLWKLMFGSPSPSKADAAIGVHSPDILGSPEYFIVESLTKNRNGTYRARVRIRLNLPGEPIVWSKAKTSTLPPLDWNATDFLVATQYVARLPTAEMQGKSTVHRGFVPIKIDIERSFRDVSDFAQIGNIELENASPRGLKIPWKVIRDENQKILASFPLDRIDQ